MAQAENAGYSSIINLQNGYPQGPNGFIVPNGSITFTLNVDATVIAPPGGFVAANEEIVFQFNTAGQIQPLPGQTAAKIYSNAELNPQLSSTLLGTYYLVTFYDANGARLNKDPMWWQFPEAAGATVDISQMIPISTIGGNVIFYPTNFGTNGTVTSVAFVGDGTILSATPSTPVTTSGNIIATLLTQNANLVLAGPASGGAAAPTFRSLVSADIPVPLTLNASTGNALTLANPTAATSGANQNSPIFEIKGQVWSGSVTEDDSFTMQVSIGAGVAGVGGQTLTITNKQGFANSQISMPVSVSTGQLTTQSIFVGGSVFLTSALATALGNVNSTDFVIRSSWWNGSAGITSATSIFDTVGSGTNAPTLTNISNSGAFVWQGLSVQGPLQFLNSTSGSAAYIQSKTVTLTAAQIKTAQSVPTQVLPAPGAGKAYQIVSTMSHYRFGTTAYTLSGSTALELGYGSGLTNPYDLAASSGFIDQTSDMYTTGSPLTTNGGTTANVVNGALFFFSNANPTLGDGTLTLSIQYTIIDTTIS